MNKEAKETYWVGAGIAILFTMITDILMPLPIKDELIVKSIVGIFCLLIAYIINRYD